MFSFFAKIKPSHRPRIIWAFAALFLLFGLMYANAIGIAIDLYHPVVAGAMLGFLIGGIIMLIYSWFEGLDGVIEWVIIFLLLGLHVALDINLIGQMQQGRISLDLVQYAVEMYWIAGLVDMLIMGWSGNAERLKKGFKSAEQLLQERVDSLVAEVALLEKDKALLELSYSTAGASSQHDKSVIEDLRQQLASRDEKHEKEIDRLRAEFADERQRFQQQLTNIAAEQTAKANATYTETCELCTEVFSFPLPESAKRALRAHQSNPKAIEKCQRKREALGLTKPSANGHSHAVEVETFQAN